MEPISLIGRLANISGPLAGGEELTVNVLVHQVCGQTSEMKPFTNIELWLGVDLTAVIYSSRQVKANVVLNRKHP